VPKLKAQQSPESDAKHAAMAEWVAAVNEDGRFGLWKWAVAYQPVEVHDVIAAL
jgi:hypothetical protein